MKMTWVMAFTVRMYVTIIWMERDIKLSNHSLEFACTSVISLLCHWLWPIWQMSVNQHSLETKELRLPNKMTWRQAMTLLNGHGDITLPLLFAWVHTRLGHLKLHHLKARLFGPEGSEVLFLKSNSGFLSPPFLTLPSPSVNQDGGQASRQWPAPPPSTLTVPPSFSHRLISVMVS